jgi:hypothetical protein
MSLMFTVVFWDILPCKMIVDRRFRGVYCLHHPWWAVYPRRQLWTSSLKYVMIRNFTSFTIASHCHKLWASYFVLKFCSFVIVTWLLKYYMMVLTLVRSETFEIVYFFFNCYYLLNESNETEYFDSVDSLSSRLLHVTSVKNLTY